MKGAGGAFPLWLLFVLAIYGVNSVDIPAANQLRLGQPRFFLQEAFGSTVTFQLAQVQVPLPDETADSDLHHLSETFLCPASDACGSAPPPACVCDFTAVLAASDCQRLPGCCAAAYPQVVAELCQPDVAVPAWRALNVNSSGGSSAAVVDVARAAQPLFYRYHPAAASACRGFGFDVVPHGNSTRSFGVVVSVSFTSSRPDLASDAVVVHYTPDGSYELSEHARFCPDSALLGQFNAAHYLGSGNYRTAFIAVSTVSASPLQLGLLDSPLQLRLVETNSVQQLTAVVGRNNSALACTASPGGLPCLSDGLSVYGYGSSTDASTFQYYYLAPPSADSCRVVSFNVRAQSGCDANLYINRAAQSNTAWFFNTTWMSRKRGADAELLYVCPDEPLIVGVNIYLGAGAYVLSVSSAAPYIARSLAHDVSPLWLGSSMLGAARLVCSNATTASRFPLGGGEGDWRCTSWYGTWFENCRQFFPLGPVAGVNALWPPPPPPFGDVLAAAALNVSQLNQVVSLAYRGDAYWAAVLLVRTDLTAVQSRLRYWTAEQLTTCRIDFLNKLYDADKLLLLRGRTAPLQRRPSVCSPQQLHAVRRDIKASLQTLVSDRLGSNLLTQNFRTALFSVDQRWSNCTELLDSYSQPDQLLVGQPVTPPCSVYDPCCPSARPGVKGLYNACLQTSASVLNTVAPRTALIDANCSNVACVTQMVTEAGHSVQYISGEPIDKCAANAKLASRFNDVIAAYVDACRSRYVDRYGVGIECSNVSDCPGADSGRVVCSALHRNSDASTRRRDGAVVKRCLADSALLDQLVFDCLVATVPSLLDQPLRTALGIAAAVPFTDPTARAALWQAFSAPGCLSTAAADSLTFADYFSLVNQDGPSCAPRDGCPLALTCSDQKCPLPYLCQTPWRSCSYGWTKVQWDAANDTCTNMYRCDYVPPASTSGPAACNSDSHCRSVCGAVDGAGYCGYCDAATQLCYELAGVDSPAACQAVTSACFLPDEQRLTAGADCPAGSCSVLAATTGSSSSDGEADCQQRVLCSFAPGTRPIRGDYCQQFNGQQWPACTASVTTASGCALLDPNTGAPLPTAPATPDQCNGQPDPFYPNRSTNWIRTVRTPDDCLEQDALKVCFVPGQSTPTQYDNATCASVGGVRRSPYTFRQGRYSAARAVAVAWRPRNYTRVGQPGARLSYAKMQLLWAQLYNQYLVYDTVATAECRYFSPAVEAVSALSCSCQPPDSPSYAEMDSARCQRLSTITSRSKPPPTLATVSVVCRNFGGDVVAPPALLHLPDNFTFAPSRNSCLALNVSYLSAGRFLTARSRVRASSFFVSRQDEHVPALGVLNRQGVVVGKILSDGVRLSTGPSRQLLVDVQLCIELRRDFVQDVLAANATSQQRLVRRFALGVASDDFKQVNPFRSDDADRISVRYFVPPAGNASQLTAFALLPRTRSVCLRFRGLQSDRHVYFAIAVSDDVESETNGFSSEQEHWLYATGAAFLFAIVIYLPTFVVTAKRLYAGVADALKINVLAATMLMSFFVLRGALLIALGTGAVLSNTTAEFALSEFATWGEYTAISLITIFLYVLLARSSRLKKTTVFNSNTLLICAVLAGLLLALLVAFLIAFDQAPADDGITNALVSCLGRVEEGESFWTTRRILRFTYSVLVACCALVLGVFLLYLLKLMNGSAGLDAKALMVFNITAVMATFSLLAHSIIAIALLASGYNDFAFTLAMIWVTELVPLTIFLVALTFSVLRDVGRAVSQMSFSIRNRSSRSSSATKAARTGNSSQAQPPVASATASSTMAP